MAGLRSAGRPAPPRARGTLTDPPPPRTRTVEGPRRETEKPPAGLGDFGSYFPAARRPVTALPGGGPTVETFTVPQVRAIKRLYFSVGPGVSFAELERRCLREPEFRGRPAPRHANYVELFRAMREHFPWSWKGRSYVASSHALVDALLTTPAGTTYGEVLDRLKGAHGGGFTHGQALRTGARSLWLEQPESYPFAARLPKTEGGSYDLRCLQEETELRYDLRGRLNVNEPLRAKVAAFFEDPRFKYHFTQRQFCDLVAREIPGFGLNQYNRLQKDFGLPDYSSARKLALARLCETIHHLHFDQGMEHAKDVLDALHQNHGYPRFEASQLSFFRREFPTLVPDFRQSKINDRIAQGRALAEAIRKAKKVPWAHTAKKLGYSSVELHRILHALRRYEPEALPFGTWNPWTPEDVTLLQKAVDESPIGATQADILRTLRAENPELFERHDISQVLTISVAIRKHLGIEDWHAFQRSRFEAAFAAVARRSPEASITDLAHHLSELHPDGYCVGYVLELARRWRADPEAHPEIAPLLDPAGKFPWEKVRVDYTPELATRIAKLIKAQPGRLLRDYTKILRSDPAFLAKWPSFGADHIAGVRVRFPKLVPYVDELKVEGHAQWLAERSEAMERLAGQIETIANQSECPEDLTLAGLARTLDVTLDRVLRTVRNFPDRFPWYAPSHPGGTQDLYLATRVAHQMETAPAGMTLSALVEALHQDPAFHAAYPSFTVNSFGWLRGQYPELVPEWATRNQILRSKLLVDALLTAPRGARYDKVIQKLRRQHPGAFGVAFDRPDYVLKYWEANPERFPFAEALRVRGQLQLVGRGTPGRVEKREPNLELAARLARLEALPERLPLVEAVANALPNNCFADYECVAIQHLLDSQVPTFAAYKQLGLSPQRTSVIGVPYSANSTVVDRLQDEGWQVQVPPLDLGIWKEQIRETLLERLSSALENNRKILVLDDGGLTAELLDSDPDLRPFAHLFKIVEQTTRGIRVAEGLDLHSPLIDVGTSWGKYVEGPLIGGDVSAKWLERLLGIGIKAAELKGKHVGITGFGTIGQPLVEALRSLGAIVTVHDTDPDKLEAADQRGIRTSSSRAEFFQEQDFIIGTTGEQSIREEDLPHLKDGVVLASASSKLVEIDVGALAEASNDPKGRHRIKTIDGESHPPTVEYTLAGGRKVRLLARGFPINFDGGPENIPPEEIQLTRTLMLLGAAQAVGAKVAGFNMLDPGRQLDALEIFEQLGIIERRSDVQAALSLAKLKLSEAKRRPGAVNRRLG